MANGEFLRDISEGIFGRLGELRKEQEAKDEATKLNTIKLLSGVADQIEPEGLPTLMRHLGDVVGVKGKLKGFWDAFSGMPNRSVEDQLGTSLRDFSQGLVGSETARKARAGGDLARLFQPQTPEQKANQAKRFTSEADLQGKMIFRDPRAEKIQEIKSRAEVQEQLAAERASTQAYYQGLRQEDAQKHQEAMKKLGESLRAKRGLRAEAEEIALLDGVLEPTQEHFERAARNLQVRGQLDDDAKRQLIEVREADAALKRKQTAAIGPTGIKPGEERRLGIAERREVNTLQEKHQQALAKAAKAKAAEDAIVKEINDVIGQYLGAKFTPGKGIEGPDVGAATLLAEDKLKEYRAKSAEREAAEQEAKGFFDVGGRKEYGRFLRRGKTHLEPMTVGEPEKPTPATKKGAAPTAPQAQLKLGPFNRIMRVPNPGAFKEGEEIPMQDGKTYKVTGIGKDHIRLAPIIR